MVLGVREIRFSGEPVLDRDNGEELMRVQPGTDIVLGNLPRESPGTLYITTKQVIWIDTEEADDDLSDSESNPIEQDLSNVKEMRLIPSDPTQLDTLFAIFCQCAELNPEPNDDEEEEEHDWVFSADQMVDEEAEDEDYISHNPVNSIGQSNGNHDLARTILELQINDRRFEDAEEMDDNEDGTHH